MMPSGVLLVGGMIPGSLVMGESQGEGTTIFKVEDNFPVIR